MMWHEQYQGDQQPDALEISSYVGSPLWDELCSFIEVNYQISPKTEYSKCSMNKGWNVKYKKGSRSICVLYPNEGFFTCLVSIGSQEASETEMILTVLTPYVQKLYADTKPFNGSRWLMIDVTEEQILIDVKELISIRVKAGKS